MTNHQGFCLGFLLLVYIYTLQLPMYMYIYILWIACIMYIFRCLYIYIPQKKKKTPHDPRHQLHRRALAADIAHGFLLMAMHQLLRPKWRAFWGEEISQLQWDKWWKIVKYIYIHYKYILIYGYFMVKMAITIVIYVCVWLLHGEKWWTYIL